MMPIDPKLRTMMGFHLPKLSNYDIERFESWTALYVRFRQEAGLQKNKETQKDKEPPKPEKKLSLGAKKKLADEKLKRVFVTAYKDIAIEAPKLLSRQCRDLTKTQQLWVQGRKQALRQAICFQFGGKYAWFGWRSAILGQFTGNIFWLAWQRFFCTNDFLGSKITHFAFLALFVVLFLHSLFCNIEDYFICLIGIVSRVFLS